MTAACDNYPSFTWINKLVFLLIILCFLAFPINVLYGQDFRVIAFYAAKNDLAHISFVHEATTWFEKMSREHHFEFSSTNDWKNMNDEFLSTFQMLIFLDTRPEAPEQRSSFERYMRKGGRWMGFHFSAFALNNSAYPDNWKWYQDEFLACGEYKSNTWRPTAAILKFENINHPLAKGLAGKFKSAPNEWYRWEKDLRSNSNIKILLSIDPESFPLGTGPKPDEIWHSGYYPVVWTHLNYKMIYFNMGHNDIDYESGSNEELSFTFNNEDQNKLILNALMWLREQNK